MGDCGEAHERPIFRPVNRYGTVGKKALIGLDVPHIVKEALTRAGIDAKDDSHHSLRHGLALSGCLCLEARIERSASRRESLPPPLPLAPMPCCLLMPG